MSKIRKYLGYVVKAEQYICCVLLVIMLAVCFAAVVMRYAFSKPLVWSEEVILTMLIWFGFMCISIGTFGDSHIAIEGAYNCFPAPVKKACDLLRHVLLMVFGCLMVFNEAAASNSLATGNSVFSDGVGRRTDSYLQCAESG